MSFCRFSTIVCLLGVMASTGYGQYPTRVVYPRGRVVSQRIIHSNAPTNVVYQTPTPITPAPQSLCDCGCGATSSGCVFAPDCTFKISGSVITPPTERHVKDYEYVMPDESECIDLDPENLPFYDQDIPAPGKVEVPRRKTKCVERYKFERKKYTLCGCTIEVCVPCEVVCIDSSDCEPFEVDAQLLVRVRRELGPGGTKVADVWVENVRGLPKPAVLGLRMSPAAIAQKFKANVQF